MDKGLLQGSTFWHAFSRYFCTAQQKSNLENRKVIFPAVLSLTQSHLLPQGQEVCWAQCTLEAQQHLWGLAPRAGLWAACAALPTDMWSSHHWQSSTCKLYAQTHSTACVRAGGAAAFRITFSAQWTFSSRRTRSLRTVFPVRQPGSGLLLEKWLFLVFSLLIASQCFSVIAASTILLPI